LVVAVVIVAFLAGAGREAARRVFPLKYEGVINEQAHLYGLQPALVAAIVYEESKFDPRAHSAAGAFGLMQLMPETAAWAAEEIGVPELAAQLEQPKANVTLGTWYFRYLLDRYTDEEMALAAYNGGEWNLDKWLAEAGGDPDQLVDRIPFDETRNFVRRVRDTRRIYYWLYPQLR
jgi:soluble lytic murein transglycosylase